MSDKTPRFGFSFYGGAIPGSLTDDGNAFTLRDPVVHDRILAALEGHEHISTNPGHQVPDPTGLPALTLLTGGTMAAGQTLYYVVTFVDRFGLESAAGDEIAIETAAVVLTPSSPDAETDIEGGLTPGLYYYAVTALDGEDETTLSAPEMATVTEADGSVILNLPDLPEGADSLRVWRQGPGEGTYSRLAVATDVTFTDDGSIPPDPCPWDPSHQPPSENTTRKDGAVQVEMAPEDVAVLNDPAQRITAWRIYRTTVSGTYPSASLVTEVVDRVSSDSTSAFVTAYIDDGAALQAGSPPPTTQTLREPSSITLPVADALPDTTTGYPENYPLIVGDKMYVKRGTEWVLIAGGGGSGGGEPALGQRGGQDFIYTDPNDGTRWVGGAAFSTELGANTIILEPTILPGAPTPVAATTLDGSSIAWMTSVFDGGLPIDKYTIWVLTSTGERRGHDMAVPVLALTADLIDIGLWDGTETGWTWVTAHNAQGYSRAFQGNVFELIPVSGDPLPLHWGPDTAQDLYTFGPRGWAPDAALNFDTFDAAVPMPVAPDWNDPTSALEHLMDELRVSYFRYRPLQAGDLVFEVPSISMPTSANWYVDVLKRPRNSTFLEWPGDADLVFSETLFSGSPGDTSSGPLTLSMDEDTDYWIAIGVTTAGASGQVMVTAGGYDWSKVGEAQVATLIDGVSWHTRDAQADSGFGGWVCFDNDVDASPYIINIEFEDPGGQPDLTITAYSYGGSGFPDDITDLTLVDVVVTNQDSSAASVGYEQALPPGRIWLHLEQDGVGWGYLNIGVA